MGLYEAIDSLPEGARLKYESADGTTVIFEPFVRGPGRLDVTVLKQSTDATGKRHESRHDYEGLEREWCVREDKSLVACWWVTVQAAARHRQAGDA
jgi:hypothetical protein